MKIEVSNEAATWYRDELDLKDGDSLRFFVRYGGLSNVHEGFSLGINVETPENEIASTDVDNIHFFIEESDGWYFEDGNFEVIYNEKNDSPDFIVTKA